MSEYILSGNTALDAYCYIREKGDMVYPIVLNKNVRIPSKYEVEELLQESWLKNNRIEVLLADNRKACKSRNVKQSFITTKRFGIVARVRSNDAFTILDGKAIVSPVFLLAQLSKKWDFLSLYNYALELGGTYSINLHSGILTSDCAPLLSSRSLNGIVDKLNQVRWAGICNLRKVAKFFCEGSASPMESELYAKLSLPTRDGGLGIDGLTMNSNIELSDEAHKIAGQPYVRVDILHRNSKVVLEYDSRTHHSSVDQSQKDKQRRDALQYDGYKCFSIVPRQINNKEVFNACMKPVVEAIKGRYRIRAKKFGYSQSHMFAEFSDFRRKNIEKIKNFYNFLYS